jgi:hypothetical protein
LERSLSPSKAPTARCTDQWTQKDVRS